MRPHHLRSVAPAVGAFGDEVIDATLAVFVARIPVLDGGVFDLCILQQDQLNNSGVQLVVVTLRCGATFEVADIRSFVGDDQRALKLAGIFSVDAEIRRQFHRTTGAGRNVDERPVRKDRRIQRCIEVVGHWNDRSEVFLHQLRMLFDGFRDRAEDDASSGEFFFEGGAQRDAVEHGVDGDFALGRIVIFCAFDARQNGLLFQRDAELFVSSQ